MDLRGMIEERVARLQALYELHEEWMRRGDRLIERVSQEVYYPSKAGHGVLVLRWRRCARGDRCVWCASRSGGAHGPYWFVVRRWANGTMTSQYVRGRLTRTAMRKAMGHTRGYERLLPLVEERELVVEAVKAIRDALRKIDRALQQAETRAGLRKLKE